MFINADQDASYDALIGALDQVRSLGITKVSFAVKKGNQFDPAAAAAQRRTPTRDGAAGQRPLRAPAAPAAPRRLRGPRSPLDVCRAPNPGDPSGHARSANV